MNIRFHQLVVSAKRSEEVIPFSNVTYFYGKMGAGKSSIARLIDYCLGANLEYTPALQSEFVAATLHLSVNDTRLVLERYAQSNQIRAQWGADEAAVDVIIPARVAAGEVIQGTSIEVISDLFFYLCGIQPPKVRRSKIKEDSELARLSLRDLLWYCYLDQDTIDSSFFNLDVEFKKLKSRDVLRFVIGFHQERVAELEAQVEEVHTERLRLVDGAQALKEALEAAGIENETAMQKKLAAIQQEMAGIVLQLESARNQADRLRTHAVDALRRRGRKVAYELEAVEQAIHDVEEVLAEDKRQLNELTTLKLKFRRVLAARSVLNGVAFEACPRCAQPLPDRETTACQVCGQTDTEVQISEDDLAVTERDADARIKELSDTLHRQEAQLKNLRRRQSELAQEKGRIDGKLDHEMSRYDSAYLSNALNIEMRRAALEQQFLELEKLRILPQKVTEQLARADELSALEKQLRRDLAEIRQEAEKDTRNLRLLADLFLDCLVRAHLPGFTREDDVLIRPPTFLPEVLTPETGEMIVASFANLGSGGKKTLFKCCFALAVHRLAVKVGALLPTFLIIDSPMKNISERENREQFEDFHQLLYELAADELRHTQMILIDKESYPPKPELKLEFTARHMQPEGSPDPPLISYYQGH